MKNRHSDPHDHRNQPPIIGMVSLGCPKALVDSERILTRLRAEGYTLSRDYQGADAVIVNTCGFLETTRNESLAAIGDAVKENGRVIVTGCLGTQADFIRKAHPSVMAITGPHQYEDVIAAVHQAIPPAHEPFMDLVPPQGIRLTPRHYAYLKISEGCHHQCSFCIIPSLRGPLASRPMEAVLREAEQLAKVGVKELLVVSQDTSAYGLDIRHAHGSWRQRPYRTHLTDLCRELGEIGIWIRLHYVYPYPHVDEIIPLMAEGKILPYLDIPFQHASPGLLKRMNRPANEEKTLERLSEWRKICPEIALRSSFIVGFPGETEQDFDYLLQWIKAARIDRIGCFKYENVTGARAQGFDNQLPEEVKEERWHRFMETAQSISSELLAQKIGKKVTVIVDQVESDGATCRTPWDSPTVDGNLFIDSDFDDLKPGDQVQVRIDESSEYDLWGQRLADPEGNPL